MPQSGNGMTSVEAKRARGRHCFRKWHRESERVV